MKEIWRPVPNWENYEVSSLGNIRSVDRLQKHSKTGKSFIKKGKLRKKQIVSGYEYVRLCQSGVCKTEKVHRLVCLAFYGKKENLEVNHKNGIKSDNRVENLEWCTKSENIIHAFSCGLMSMKGEDNSRAKLTITKTKMIIALGKAGFTNSQIGEIFKISPSTVSAIYTGRNWNDE